MPLTESPAGGVQTGAGPKASRSPGPLWDSVLHWWRLKPGPTPTHTDTHTGGGSLGYNKKKTEIEKRTAKKKEIPDLCHISASDYECRRCIFLARLLNVVDVQTDGTKRKE